MIARQEDEVHNDRRQPREENEEHDKMERPCLPLEDEDRLPIGRSGDDDPDQHAKNDLADFAQALARSGVTPVASAAHLI